MAITLFLLLFYLGSSIGLYFIFEKTGEQGWKGLVPGLNFVVWCKLVGRKPAHALWLLFPIVNIFIWVGLCIDMVRSFGKHSFWQSFMAVVATPVIFILLGRNKSEKYQGPALTIEKQFKKEFTEAREANDQRKLKKMERENPYKKSGLREWAEAIIFAVFAAAFIRMFLIEAYVIPTPSMEDSLKVGDFLFVSKAHYGIRTPKTVLMVPLLHNRLPIFDSESYISTPSIKPRRLPALETVDRNDPVVFNFPDGDSVYVFKHRTWSINDYRYGGIPETDAQQIRTNRKKLVVRPVDKKDHYIKRCIAVGGDTLQIKDKQVFINGQMVTNPVNMEYMYLLSGLNNRINTSEFDKWGISSDDVIQIRDGLLITLTNAQKNKLESIDTSIHLVPFDFSKLESNPYKLFPHDPKNISGWTNDNYGPIYIPKKGATIQISPQNIALYRKIIGVYEGNRLEEKNGKIFINGQEASSYTFRMNYYWMMGDNRHNSEDSRVWGFVPEDHVVGKPLFIWFSTKEGKIANGINWDRIFKSVGNLP